MKIQGLTIIFIIIILPISIIIGEFANAQIKLIRTEQIYDSQLITATGDGLKAFQINTFNNTASDIVDSKLSNIEASVNAFYNSMESGFKLQGYSRKDLVKYVPALVYTMYDGYYIYSPYTDIAKIEEVDENTSELVIDLENGEIQYGLKPYVYYSSRYVKGNIDVVINYSLDNYITVQGWIGPEWVYESGYLITIAQTLDTNNSLTNNEIGVFYQASTGKYYYNGAEILPEAPLTENLVEKDTNTGEIITKTYEYIKLNGIKYYLNEEEECIFYLLGSQRIKQVTKSTDAMTYNKYVNQIKNNTSAINYYKNAYKFTTWINNNLGTLTSRDSVDNILDRGNQPIFENLRIEYPDSNFNAHRKNVIRYSIESNLATAIANFNEYTSSSTNFQMPKLKETDWEMLQNEISIISFLQGINMGGKIYNGYTVVTNNKTKEVVKEDRIYITTSDGYYHKINDKELIDSYDIGSITGAFENLDFEQRKDSNTQTYYTNRTELGCYTSIVSQKNVDNSRNSIYEYLEEKEDLNKTIKQIYYTALGRERWGSYKVENPSKISDILYLMNEIN